MIHKFVLPRQFPQIVDHEAKYLLMAGLALAERDLCLLVGANPALFLKFLELIKSRWDGLLKFLERGSVKALGLAPDCVRFLPEGFSGKPDRARELRRFKDSSAVSFQTLWPLIRTVVTWTGGSCGAVLPQVRGYFSQGTRFLEMGYLASEFIGTLTLDAQSGRQLPTFYDNVFEFVDAGEWERKKDQADVLGLEEIEPGRRYQIIVTAWNGFYRYAINDIVEVTGRFNETPTLQFVQKGRGVVDLAGERLYENHLIAAINVLSRTYGVHAAFFLMLGNPKARRYTLFLETENAESRFLQEVLERELGAANAGYGVMRSEGTLEPLEVIPLRRGAGEAYKEHCLRHGQREAQYKAITLQYRQECRFDFSPFQTPQAGCRDRKGVSG
ncbi:MAG TPA: GH3 auxin-responsive promoter family protein, partial [Sphingomonadales bacterium]|nr:GH3 auxin-responsive promoter family protein [Sphingomonadales bacterium]